jgi:hypothetical protein
MKPKNKIADVNTEIKTEIKTRYVVGGIAYFAIPWALGTLMSSVALGLEDNPIFPTYPRVSVVTSPL